MLTVIVRSAFEDEDKFYPQVYLGKCLYVYMSYKC